MNPFRKLFSRKMDRREFLKYLGLFLLTVTGIFGVLKNLTHLNLSKNKGGNLSQAFGAGPYGGTNQKE